MLQIVSEEFGSLLLKETWRSQDGELINDIIRSNVESVLQIWMGDGTHYYAIKKLISVSVKGKKNRKEPSLFNYNFDCQFKPWRVKSIKKNIEPQGI